MFRKNILLLVLLFFPLFFYGQSYDFQNFSQENGMPSSSVNVIFQDSRNFIWIGTAGGGLVKYDGLEFSNYQKSNGLNSNFIVDIVEDVNNNIITINQYDGISVFKKDTFLEDISTGNYTKDLGLFSRLLVTKEGVIAISNKSIGLIKSDYTFKLLADFSNSKIERVNSIIELSKNNFLIGTEKGFFQIRNNKFFPFYQNKFSGLCRTFKDVNGKIYLSNSKSEIYSYSNKNLKLLKIFTNQKGKLIQISSFFVAKNGTIWISDTVDKSISVFQGYDYKLIENAYNYNVEGSVYFFQDKNHTMYFGSSQTGFYKLLLQNFISLKENKYFDEINVYFLTNYKNKFYTSANYGLIRVHEKVNSNKFNYIGNLPFTSRYSMVNNKKQMVFGYEKGLAILDNEQFTYVDIVSQLNLSSFKAQCIFQDKDSNYYLGTYGNGLIILDKNFKVIKHFFDTNKDEELSNYIYSIIDKDKNSFYVSSNRGLFVLSKHKNEFDLVRLKINDSFFLSVKDKHQNTWFIGSNNVYAINPNGNVKKYNKSTGLPSNIIFTLIPDKNNDILIGSNLGITRLKINKEADILKIENFNNKNGFTGIETNTSAQTTDANGDLYFGTIRGIYKYVVNNEIKPSKKAKVNIVNLKLFNEDTVWESKNWFNIPEENFVFKSNENQISFKFLSINDINVNSLNYSFKLDGVNNAKWSSPSLSNEVTFSNLDYGNYTFRVKIVDSQNKQLSPETTYSFSINSPFYLSWWFILSTLAVIYLVISIIFNKSSKYNKDFIKNYTNIQSQIEKYKLYLIFIGITVPILELIVEVAGVRERNTLQFNIITSVLGIIIYVCSNKFKLVNKYLPNIFVTLFIFISVANIYRIIQHPNNIWSAIEFIIILFISINIFNSIKNYRIFVITVFVTIMLLFLGNYISKTYSVILLSYCVLVTILNHVKYISDLNSNYKFLFANNIVNKGTTLVISFNNSNEVVFCSETISQILGYTPEEVIGLDYWKLTNTENYLTDSYQIQDSLYVRMLKCKDGSYKHIQWKDSKYNSNTFIAIGQDVTEQIAVQNQYQKLIENANDIIYEVDITGRLVFYNSFTQKILGYSSEELIGKHYKAFILPEYIDKVQQFYLSINDNDNSEAVSEFPIYNKFNVLYWISQKVTLVKDPTGEIVGYSAIARDITQLKLIELEKIERQQKMESFNQTINILINKRYDENEPLEDVIKFIIKTCAIKAKIDHVSFSNFSPKVIKTVCSYSLKEKTFKSGKIFTIENYPKYFNDFNQNKIVISAEALNNNNPKNTDDNKFNSNNTKSVLDVPVILNAEKIAILSFESLGQKRNWDNDDVNFARSISDIISLAIEAKKRLETEIKLKSKTKILSGIAIASEKLLKSKSISSSLDVAFEAIGNETNIDRVCYYDYDSTISKFIKKHKWINQKTDKTINIELPREISNSYLSTLKNKQVFKFIVSDIKDQKLKNEYQELKIKSILVFPIFVRNEFCGFIRFDDCTTERIWTVDEVDVLQILVNNIATSIERIENEKLLQESEERFKLLANNIPGTVYLSENNENWSKVYINDEVEKLTGFLKEQFLSNEISLLELVHSDDRQYVIQSTINAINDKKSFRLNYRVKHIDGHYVWVEEFGDVILKEGKVAYIEGILIDDTQKKEIENEIKARQFAEASNNAKSEFLANMSHEIRTPLNAIIGFSSIIKETDLNKSQHKYITTINQSANVLLEVVNNILDFSKIETGKLELDEQNSDLTEIASQVLEIVKFDSEQKKLNLNLNIDQDIPKFVNIDSLRLKQVLLNLLTNAIKFTNEGNVDLTIKMLEKNKTNVNIRFEVKDTGVGIKKDNIKKIFEPFSQEDNSTTRKYGGTGLGLAISNKILELMNSKLELISNFNKGSLFYFDLNLKCNTTEIEQIEIVADDKVETEQITSVLHQSKKILIIEDNSINMLLAKTLVLKTIPNAILFEASNGKLGLEKFIEVSPDLILLDIQMPVLNGYETCQEIRKINTTVPIIALTAGTIQGEKEKCLKVGMNDYISKPIVKEIFEKAIHKWL